MFSICNLFSKANTIIFSSRNFKSSQRLNIIVNLQKVFNIYQKYLHKNSFEHKFNSYLNDWEQLNYLKNNLKIIDSNDSFKLHTNNFLRDFKLSNSESKIENLNKFLSVQGKNIELNEYNYYKYKFYKTSFLTAYFIIWSKNAQHLPFHPLTLFYFECDWRMERN